MATLTLVHYIYLASFQYMDLGIGAAVATLLLILLAILGLAAGALAVFSGLKFGMTPKPTGQGSNGQTGASNGLRKAGLIIGLLAGLAALVVGILPLGATFTLPRLGQGFSELQGSMPPGENLSSLLTNTLLPPLISMLLLQFPFSYLGALGIGALRPLGRRSEWLLLPFSPWLFTGLAPFSVIMFKVYSQMGLWGNTATLIQPLAISVPMLVVLTLFFKGQEKAFRDDQALGMSGVKAFFVHYVFPSLPLAVLLVIAGVFASMLDFFWSLVFASQKLFTVNTIILFIRQTNSASVPALAVFVLLALIPAFLVAFLAFGVFQIFYVDRLSLSAGHEPE